MRDSKWTKPATACGEPASNLEHLGGPLGISHTPSIITAQLVGDDTAIADGITARGALDLCRRLLDAGFNSEAELLCYRANVLALRIRSIALGAQFTIRETATDGPRVVRWKAFSRRNVSAPMRQTEEVVQ
jgi:hypothetical protein